VFAVLFVIVLLSAPLWLRAVLLNERVAARIKTQIETTVSDILQQPLEIEDMRFDLWGRARATGLRLGSGDTAILQGGELTVTLNWIRLAHNLNTPESAITGIVISRPVLFLHHDAQGKWNYPKPKSQAQRQTPAYPRLHVQVRDASLRFRDDFATPSLYIRDATVLNLSATVDIYKSGRITVKADSEDSSVCAGLDAFIDLNPQTGFSAGGMCLGANPAIATQVGGLYKVSLSGKPVDVSWNASARYRGMGKRPDYTVSAELHFKGYDVSVPAYDMHITDARGALTYANGRVRLDDVHARFAGGHVTAQGIITLGKPLHLLVRAEAEDIDIKRAGAWMRERVGGDAQGIINGWVFIAGDPHAPDITAEASVDAPRWDMYHADRAQALVSYSRGALDISRANIFLRGAQAQASGLVHPATAHTPLLYSLAARFQNAAVDDMRGMLPFEMPDPLSATVSGRIMAVKTADSLTPMYYGSVSSADMAYDTLDQLQASAAFSSEKGRTYIENAAVSGAPGYAVVSGVADERGGLDFEISGAQANVRALLDIAGYDDVQATGALMLSGALAGTGKVPVFTGRVTGGAVSAASLSVQELDGGLRYATNTLTLENLTLDTGRGQHEIRGRIALDGSLLDLELNTRNVSLEQTVDAGVHFAKIAPPDIPGLSGVLSAQVRVTGSAKKPLVHAHVSIQDAAAYGEHMSMVQADAVYDGGLRLDNGQVKTAASDITFSGAMDHKKQLDFKFASKKFHVDDLDAASKYEAGGVVAFQGTVAGASDDPMVSASITSSDLRVRTLAFKLARAAQVTYGKGLIAFKDAVLTRGAERYEVQGAYQSDTERLTAKVTFSNASPSVVSSYLQRPLPEGTSGSFEGEISVIAHGENVSAKIAIAGADASIGAYPLTSVSLNGTYTGGAFEVDDFQAVNQTSQYMAHGMIDLKSPELSLLNVEATRVDLAMLSRLGMIPAPASGTVDIFVDVAEDEGRSYLSGSLHAYDCSAMGVSFDQSRGSFEFNGRTLTVTQLQFIRDRQRVMLRGDIPVPSTDGRAPEHPLQLVLSTENFDLETLNPLLARWGVSLSGSVEVQDLVFKGQADRPQLSGAVLLSGVTLKHADLHQPVEQISGALRADGSRLVLENISGVMSGKKLILQGGVTFEGLHPGYVLELQDVDNLFVGYKDIYKGRVDVHNLRLEGDTQGMAFDPLKGNTTVTLHDGAFTLVPLGEEAAAASSTFKISVPGDKLTIEAGDNFVARTPGNTLYIRPRGSLRIGGLLTAPELRGYFAATDGYVKLPVLGVKFKLVEEAVIGFHTIEGVGLVPFLVARATARTSGMDLTVDVSGPLIDLNLYPEYQRICAVETTDQTVGGIVSTTTGGAAVSIGGGYTAPLCPSFKFSGTDKEGNQITNDQVFNKLTRPDQQSEDQSTWTTLAQNSLLSWGTGLGSEFITEKSPIDEFELSLDPNKDIFIQLEKCVDQKFCLRYERLFSEAEKTQFDLLYKFRKRSYLLWGINEENESTYEIEYRLNF